MAFAKAQIAHAAAEAFDEVLKLICFLVWSILAVKNMFLFCLLQCGRYHNSHVIKQAMHFEVNARVLQIVKMHFHWCSHRLYWMRMEILEFVKNQVEPNHKCQAKMLPVKVVLAKLLHLLLPI